MMTPARKRTKKYKPVTNVFWAMALVRSPRTIFVGTFSFRRQAINRAVQMCGMAWSELYKRGYRAVKVRLIEIGERAK